MNNKDLAFAAAPSDALPAAKSPAKAKKKPIARLSPEEIRRRAERRRPRIAAVQPLSTESNDSPAAVTAVTVEAALHGVGAGPGDGTGNADEQHVHVTGASCAGEPVAADVSDARASEAPLGRERAAATVMRQLTVWETHEDPAVVAKWAAAMEITHPPVTDPQVTEPATEGGRRGSFRIRTADDVVDREQRRAALSQVTVHHQGHLVPEVRDAVVGLVLEHPYVSALADDHIARLGLRFAVWSLTKTPDGAFDPFRDLTESRIAGYTRYLGSSVSEASKSSYTSSLRRLAGGSKVPRPGTRRAAVAPHDRRAEDGFWTAADAFAPHSLEHTEAKTMLASTFGAGALPEEVNLVSPVDVLVDGDRVTLRLVRDTMVSRDLPVTEPRYADWLADRAAQLTAERYLFQLSPGSPTPDFTGGAIVITVDAESGRACLIGVETRENSEPMPDPNATALRLPWP